MMLTGRWDSLMVRRVRQHLGLFGGDDCYLSRSQESSLHTVRHVTVDK